MAKLRLPAETPEEIEYNRCLQLDIFRDAIHDKQPYADVYDCFTDVTISAAEYDAIMTRYHALKDEKIIRKFMDEKGYADERDSL